MSKIGKFQLTIEIPDGVLFRDIKEAVMDALGSYGGQYMPKDPKFNYFKKYKIRYLNRPQEEARSSPEYRRLP